ncbi:hypothetical protein [Clostridium merdae]|uniref:hypothetical protein n=1 Tax=Clostridium merdae TaxID=1958780 RepID=UPI000A26B203|nr:hypothetical protein [Clostridium merdae]
MRKIDAERELSRIPKAEPLVVERESKGRESILSLWKAFAYFHPFVKVGARPGTRGKALRQQNPCAVAQFFFPNKAETFTKSKKDSTWHEGKALRPSAKLLK